MAQYPHSITITRKAEYSQNENGNFKPVDGESVEFTSDCRAEIAGSRAEIAGIDGKIVKYSWIVYLPRTSQLFEFGDAVVVDREGLIINAVLIQQSNGQFNTRIWV